MRNISTEFRLVASMMIIGVLTLLSHVSFFRLDYKSTQLIQFQLLEFKSDLLRHPTYAKNYYELHTLNDLNYLKNNTDQFYVFVNQLDTGGVFRYGNEFVEIIPNDDSELSATIAELQKNLRTYKKKIDEFWLNDFYVSDYVSANFQDASSLKIAANHRKKEIEMGAVDYISSKHLALITLTEALSESVTQAFERTQATQQKVNLFILLIIIGLSIYNVMLLRQNFFAPLDELTLKIAKLARISRANFAEQLRVINHAIEIIESNFKDATQFAKSIGEGRFDAKLSVLPDDDLLGKTLTEMRDKLRTFSEEERVSKWSTDGLAHIAVILSSNMSVNMSELSLEFVRYIVKYLNINQGAVFMRNDEEQVIELVSAYAFDKKKYISKKIEEKEGLVGQVVAEGASIYLTKAPQDYILITSGLGELNPDSVLISPIKLGQNIYGAIELASFRKFLPHEIHFVETACERFGAAISVFKMNKNTQRLLAESQQVNEELQRKEEIMRLNAEELQSTQEKLRKNLQQLKEESNLIRNIVEAINKTSATIEFDMQGNILSVNEMYLNIMGYNAPEIIGQNEKILVPQDDLNTSRYDLLWDSLRNGSFISGEYRRLTKEGREVWLNGTYNPIFSVEGVPYKVIQLAQFTTEEKEKDLDFSGKLNAISAAFPLIDLNITGNVQSANATFTTLFGFKRKNMRSLSFRSLIADESMKLRYDLMFAKVLMGEHQADVLPLLTADQQTRHCLVNLSPINNLAGQISKILVTLADVSNQKQLEAQLSSEHAMLTILNSELHSRLSILETAAMVFETDTEGKILSVNSILENKLKINDIEQKKYHILELITDHHSDEVQHLLQSYQQVQIRRAVAQYKTADGNVFWADTTIAPVLDELYKPIKYTALMFDVTDQILYRQALIEELHLERSCNSLLKSSIKYQDLEEMLNKVMNEASEGESERYYQNLLENQYFITMILDKDACILEANALALRYDFAKGKSVGNSLIFNTANETAEFFAKVALGTVVAYTAILKTSHGERACKMMLTPVFTSGITEFHRFLFVMPIA